jgi:hypothetical protein
LSFYEGVGVGVLKIEELEPELLCTDPTALLSLNKISVSKDPVFWDVMPCGFVDT